MLGFLPEKTREWKINSCPVGSKRRVSLDWLRNPGIPRPLQPFRALMNEGFTYESVTE
jgi:hypothetical protein